MVKVNLMDYLLGGIAALGGTFFSNPFEVVKTRIQLQGELAPKGTYEKPYRGVLLAFIRVAKNEGLVGLQKGLVPALGLQFILNSIRLGAYNGAKENGLLNNRHGNISFFKGLLVGATGGSIGTFIASPLFLVKTQLQSRAPKHIAVGTQHPHTGMSEALKSIYRKHGIRGLWRGSAITIPRGALGSGSQIATFGKTKSWLRRKGYVVQPILNSFVASLLAGWVMAIVLTPTDVLATRLFNQAVDENGKGVLYNGVVDCGTKILRSEGIFGLYKGFWPNYLRIAPHSTIILMIFDNLLVLKARWIAKANKNEKDIST